MKIEDIIESLNRNIENKRIELNLDPILGHLVLQKTIKPHSTFKAYKEYTFTIWFVKNGTKHIIMKLANTDKVIEGRDEMLVNRLSKELCYMLFNWVGSESYKQIIKGEYNGDINE